ncbi:MAG: hypothetical protein U0793_14990 [Gemmataceae bacterium]
MGRLAALTLALLTAVAHAQEGTEVGVRLDTLSGRLKEAKAVKVVFAATLKADDKQVGSAEGEVMVAKGNKARVQMKTVIDGKSEQLLLIADGKDKQLIVDGRAQNELLEPNLTANLHAVFRKSGLMHAILLPLDDKAPPDLDKILKISKDKFIGITKEEKRSVYKCEYVLGALDKEFNVELWLDNRTQLPLKRVLRSMDGGKSVVIEETTRFEIDPPLAKDIFELKKDKCASGAP